MAEVGITIPEQLIQDLVRAAVVRALGDQDKLMEGIVNAALSAKANSYDKDTLFMKATHQAIQRVANEVLQEWIGSKKEAIKAEFMRQLNSRNGLAVKKLADGLVDGISKYRVTVNFNWSE